MKVLGVERTMSDAGDPLTFLEFETSQRYRHAFGSNSPFFAGLEEGVLRATRCTSCENTSFPPRPRCDDDLSATVWYDLPGTGTIVAATKVHSPPPFGGIEAPYVLASIRLDGVEGGLLHRILGGEIPAHGTRVQARFLEDAAHPLLRLAFEIEAGGST